MSQYVLCQHDTNRLVNSEPENGWKLTEVNARLQLLDRLKSDFLSFISHELRTPLHLLAAVDLLDVHGDLQEQTELLTLIRRGYRRIVGLTEKGLEYLSWLAADQLQTDTSTDLAQVVRAVANDTPSLAAPEVEFRFSYPAVPCLVRGEKKNLARVVQILLDNALQFSCAEKFISVAVQTFPGRVVLTVTDRGTGFAPELARELFSPFTIADAKHHSQGTGLSLALASVIVQAHGGHIRAESAGVGKGATFIVDFPAFSPLSE